MLTARDRLLRDTFDEVTRKGSSTVDWVDCLDALVVHGTLRLLNYKLTFERFVFVLNEWNHLCHCKR